MRFIRKSLRGMFHLVCACVPGCGQMYQGYMKRGISQTIIACAMVFVAVFLEIGALAALIVPLWLYSFFDSYNLRRQLREGLAPEDEFMFGLSEMDSQKLSHILSRRGSLIGWALVAVGLYNVYMLVARRVFSALRDFLPWLDWLYDLMVWDMPRIMGTVLIIALGIWFIKGPKAPKNCGPDGGSDYAPPSSKPPKMKESPWTKAEEKFHERPEPQAPEVPEKEEPAPVVLTWKSEFEVEKFEKQLQEEKKEESRDGQ